MHRLEIKQAELVLSLIPTCFILANRYDIESHSCLPFSAYCYSDATKIEILINFKKYFGKFHVNQNNFEGRLEGHQAGLCLAPFFYLFLG